MSVLPTKDSIWRHYKWAGLYKVICVARDEATGKDFIVYQSLHDGQIWTRSADSWFERISRPRDLGYNKQDEFGKMPRFERIGSVWP